MKQYPKNLLRRLYTEMVRIRLFEEKLAQGVLAGEIKTPCHLYVGQEAIAVGICAHLKKTDFIFGTHRSHGHFLAKGGSMKNLMAEIYGKTTGCSAGHGGSMHIIQTNVGMMGAQPLVAGTIPIAVGSALAFKLSEKQNVTVAFFGDGAVEEGAFHEAINFAAIKKLPILFVCENNFYSSHLHIKERRPSNNTYRTGQLFCMPGIQIDGNDIIKVYEETKKALAWIKNGKGPYLIEAVTYRLRGHVGAIDKLGDQDITDIRDPEEVKSWLEKEPIRRFERYLRKHTILDPPYLEKIKKQVEVEVEQAYLFAKQSPYPDSKTFDKYIFAA